MTIEFDCACGQAISVPEAMGGKKGKCPRCGRILDVPPPRSRPAPAAVLPIETLPAASTADEKACPVCGERIKAAAIKCRFCGELIGAMRQPAP